MTEDHFPYGNQPQNAFDAQYQRILSTTQTKTQVELAEFLGIRQSSISDAKRRCAIPSDWLVKIFQRLRVNPDWILLGNGAKYAVDITDEGETLPHVVTTVEVRPPQECSAQELVNELVRRALQVSDKAKIQKDVAASWWKVDARGKSSK